MALPLPPIYVVACDVSIDINSVGEPVVVPGSGAPFDGSLSLDEELVSALPAIWYAMHLPKTLWDTIDLPLPAVRDYVSQQRPHGIALVPASFLKNNSFMTALLRGYEPVLIICSDDAMQDAIEVAGSNGFVLPPITFSELNQSGLNLHWVSLEKHWVKTLPGEVALKGDPSAPELRPLSATNGSSVPGIRLHRLIAAPYAFRGSSSTPEFDALDALYTRAFLQVLADLEDAGVGPVEAEKLLPGRLDELAPRFRLPLTLSFPGIASKYSKLAAREDHGARQTELPEQPEQPTSSRAEAADASSELEAISLMVAHRSVGSESMAVQFHQPVPAAAFHALADLERHWLEGPTPRKEAKLRDRLDDSMKHLWTREFMTVLRAASRVEAFTNFPLGLLRVPGSTAPLAAQLPIAYHPINPLTRALQSEFGLPTFADFSTGYHVLIVECIPSTDPVGAVSRTAWRRAVDELSDSSTSITMAIEETLSSAALRAAVIEHKPDILIISAHGFSIPNSNVAGILIGEDKSLGTDLGWMPPLVILSACHSAPRGGGVVAVADLLLRAGARAVVSTLVPVDVRHNAIFMTRFLVYLSESVSGNENYLDVLSVWHRVQSNNAIIDILMGNRQLSEWANTTVNGSSPLVEFMTSRSKGRLTPANLYIDSENVLLEIAEEQGAREQVAGWLRSPGYLAEGMMYTLIGDPSGIRLRPQASV
jgi:hypothetical protein